MRLRWTGMVIFNFQHKMAVGNWFCDGFPWNKKVIYTRLIFIFSTYFYNGSWDNFTSKLAAILDLEVDTGSTKLSLVLIDPLCLLKYEYLRKLPFYVQNS